MQSLAIDLFDIGALKFGSFTLKSGMVSPFYIDLRATTSYPSLLKHISTSMSQTVVGLSFDLVCGVPYTAIPFATAFSLAANVPMILKRKEKKEYGTAKMIEGIFQKGQRCLILEDVVTTGTSVLETIAALESEGIAVQDVVVLIDREQGGKKRLEETGYRLHSIFTISQLVEELAKQRKIDADAIHSIREFISR